MASKNSTLQKRESQRRRADGQKTPEYSTWDSMIQRCCNHNNPAYEYYGGRGISICNRWRYSFEAFLEDMGKRPSPKYTIERKDNNGNYNQENCIWATRKQQQRNRRVNVKLTFCGKTMTLVEWSEHLEINVSTLSKRLRRSGWDIEKALGTSGKPLGKSDWIDRYEFQGEKLTLLEWSKKTGIPKECIRSRLNRGMPIETALTTPPNTQCNGQPIKRYELHGEKLTLLEWSKKTGIHKETIRERLNRGWTLEKAITTPLLQKCKSST